MVIDDEILNYRIYVFQPTNESMFNLPLEKKKIIACELNKIGYKVYFV